MSIAIQRRALLRAALAAVLVRGHAPEPALVHRWLDTWTGVGLVERIPTGQWYLP